MSHVMLTVDRKLTGRDVITMAMLLLTATVQAQNSTPQITEATLDKGVVVGHTYKNSFLGIEFTPPEELEFRDPELWGKAGDPIRAVGISAWSKAHNKFAVRKYIVDEGIIFVADDLDKHPEDERDDAGYMRRMHGTEARDGLKAIDGKANEKIGEIVFLRADFLRGKRRHAVLVTTRYGFAFVFIFVAMDAERLESLIKSTSLKLPQ
jgi:hypothetical protein